MSKNNINKIEKDFTYKVFDEINEFTNALVNNKTLAGIGSDFQAVNLIKKGLIKEIDFKKLFRASNPNEFTNEILAKLDSNEYLKEVLKNTYTPIVFQHLESYDEALKTDSNGKPFTQPKHLWKYFIPYFAQDGMVAYNTNKNPNVNHDISYEELEANTKKLMVKYDLNQSSEDNKTPENINPYSLLNELNLLHDKGYNNFIVTDAIRTNMLYSSGYNFQNNKLDLIPYTGHTTAQDYKNQIDQFGELIAHATSFPIKDSKHISLDGDGQDIVFKMLNPSNHQTDAAIVYNGDMLDMYYSEDNFASVKQGTVKGFKIAQNILLVDGLVVASNINKEYEDKLYEVMSKSIFQNIQLPFLNIIKTDNFNDEDGFKKYATKIYEDYLTEVLKRPYFNDIKLYEKLSKNLRVLYEKTLDDINALDLYNDFVHQNIIENEEIYNIFKTYSQDLFGDTNEANLKDNIINLLNHVDLDNETFKHNVIDKSYSNIDNFTFINYTPSNLYDYKFIKRNYFIENNAVNQTALGIFEIEDNEQLGIQHKRIEFVDEKLLSLITTYYFIKYKG
ncbi:hypothetical protein [Mycoplasmopsis verecunda]|nr:hypothetical protein [Mycoplasmopsis verecunda]WPB54323.1 hypothetical protein SAM46_02425 [Mycoplasmopsis verecunda]